MTTTGREGHAMRLTIELDLGNDTMTGPADVEHALERAFDTLANGKQSAKSMAAFAVGDFGVVRDVNGNTVGTFTVDGRTTL